jgi:hypothetical protein
MLSGEKTVLVAQSFSALPLHLPMSRASESIAVGMLKPLL